jgi:hypothetical protein
MAAATPNKDLTFTEFMEKVAIYRQETGQRRGQAFFNVLYTHRSDLSEKIRGDVHLDPFYRDAKLSDATRWVQQMW